MELIRFIFSGFWHFIGFIAILNILLGKCLELIQLFIRSNNIRKHGYPPEYCDTDGDLKEEKEKSCHE